MKNNTYSLKNQHHDFNIERFKARLTGKFCVVFISVSQIIIRLIIILTEPKLDYRSRIAYIISIPLVAMFAIIVCFEYFLFTKIGPKVMNYSKLIDIVLLIIFTIEWLTTLFIILIRFSNGNPPSLSPSAVFAVTNFGWRTLFLLFLIQGWKLIIIPPTVAMLFALGFTLYYSTTGPKLILMASLSQIAYTIIMLYFLDKINPLRYINIDMFRREMVKWKEVFTNTQQERWMQINQFVLNNIPENIVILEFGGEVNFVSDYCKAFMRNAHLSQDPGDLFQKINELYLQPDNQSSSPTGDTSRQGESERGSTPNDQKNYHKCQRIASLEDLVETFKLMIIGSRIREREILIYNGKLKVEDHQTKSIEIKISFIQQYGREFIILIIRDTTQRDLLVTLEDSNKYKDQLLASVSHELRAPLNGNINLLESAVQDKSVPEKVKEGLLTPALRSSQFLSHLINDILDMSQIKAQKLRLIFSSGKLKETLKNTLQLVELQAKKKGIELSMEIHPDIVRANLCTDHVRLSQIVLNLLNNSIKFTQKGAVLLTAVPSEDLKCVKISVVDSGIGMTQENIQKLFSEFTHIEFAERKEINPTGVGLGLSISYNLAKLLGPSGSQQQEGISVESVLNEGSTFSFVIESKEEPLGSQDILMNEYCSYSADKMEQGEIDEFSISEARIASKLTQRSVSIFETQRPLLESKRSNKVCTCAKVLVVDDNPFNTMAFEAVLGSLNFKCDSVFDGKTAIEKVLERQRTFCGSNCKAYSVIFMDQEMPGQTGSETVEELRKLQVQGLVPEMKMVGCTAHGSAEKVEKFMMSGLDLCIHKPITMHEIQKILKEENYYC